MDLAFFSPTDSFLCFIPENAANISASHLFIAGDLIGFLSFSQSWFRLLWKLRQKFFVHFKAEIEISCDGKLSLRVIWSRIRRIAPKENTLVLLIIYIPERQQEERSSTKNILFFQFWSMSWMCPFWAGWLRMKIIHGKQISSAERGFFWQLVWSWLSCLNSHTIPNWWTKTIKLIEKGAIMQEISINYAWG